MFIPGKAKHRKVFKGKIKGCSKAGAQLAFGEHALKVLQSGRINSRQLEAVRKVVNRHLRRTGSVWMRIFPNIPVTKKPTDVRMGKGKGSVEEWVFRMQPGRIILEIGGVSTAMAHEALRKAAAKIPIQCRIISLTS